MLQRICRGTLPTKLDKAGIFDQEWLSKLSGGQGGVQKSIGGKSKSETRFRYSNQWLFWRGCIKLKTGQRLKSRSWLSYQVVGERIQKSMWGQMEVIKPKTKQGQSSRSGVAESATKWLKTNLEVHMGLNGGY